MSACALGLDGYVLTSAQSREVDRLALEEFGLPTLVLMENAARGVAHAALDVIGRGERVLVLAGPGNNGADALAATRHLHNAGVSVEVVLAYPPALCKTDCALHLRVVQRMGIPVRTWSRHEPLASVAPHVIIDGVFGTGLARTLDESTLALVHAANVLGDAGVLTLAIDVPTGMNADTGRSVGDGNGAVLRAAATVTFAALKPGLLTADGQKLAGVVIVADIGVPRRILEQLGVRLQDNGADVSRG